MVQKACEVHFPNQQPDPLHVPLLMGTLNKVCYLESVLKIATVFQTNKVIHLWLYKKDNGVSLQLVFQI